MRPIVLASVFTFTFTFTFTSVLGVAAADLLCGRHIKSTSVVRDHAGRLDWSRSDGLVVYDKEDTQDPTDPDQSFDIYVGQVAGARDGSDDVCLSCGKPGLRRHNGNPAWHPSGDYIVFQAELEDAGGPRFFANPGRGVNNVLWVVNRQGTEFFPITAPGTGSGTGVLHPHFSPDGTTLSWSEMVESGHVFQNGEVFGLWKLRTARFVTAGGPPHLEDIQDVTPPVPALYENHGFSPDGRELLFSSNFARGGYADSLNNDIFRIAPGTGALGRLTDTDYNEHAGFFPSGAAIVWTTNRNIPGHGADLWIMNPDGTGKDRLTFFNRAGCSPGDIGDQPIAADSSINATGDKLLVFVMPQLFALSGAMVLVELKNPF